MDFDLKKFLYLLQRTNKPWKITISGGEPFLHPDFPLICKKISELYSISILTNLTLTSAIVKTVNNANIKTIKASFHHTQMSETQVEQFIQNCLFVKNKGINLDIRYILTPSEDSSILNKYIELFSSFGLKFTLKPFKGDIEGVLYPRNYSIGKIKEFFRNDVDGSIFLEKADFFLEGKTCRTGKEFLFIENDGNIFNCPKRSYFLGNITNCDELPLLEKDVICNLPFPKACNCNSGYYYCSDPDFNKKTTEELLKEVYYNYEDFIQYES